MRKIAIVGNIASGKSEVSKILLAFGFKVLDTDKVSHDILENNSKISEIFKDYDVFENDVVSRKKIGELVFNNSELLKSLENIIHPQIRIAIKEFFDKNSREDVLFVEIPLLYEAGMQDLFDEVLFVYAPDEIRLQRLMQRNSFSKDYAQKRLDAQLSQQEKIKKATIVIENNSTIDNLKKVLFDLFMQP